MKKQIILQYSPVLFILIVNFVTRYPRIINYTDSLIALDLQILNKHVNNQNFSLLVCPNKNSIFKDPTMEKA